MQLVYRYAKAMAVSSEFWTQMLKSGEVPEVSASEFWGGLQKSSGGRVGHHHFSPRYYCASKHGSVYDSRCGGPCKQSDTQKCVVALHVAFERQILKPVFHLIGYRLWV
jgi:hypothetical protein